MISLTEILRLQSLGAKGSLSFAEGAALLRSTSHCKAASNVMSMDLS